MSAGVVDPRAPQTRAEIGRRVFAYLIDVGLGAAIAVIVSGVFFGIVVVNAPDSDAATVAVGVTVATIAVGLAVAGWAVVVTVLQGGAGSIGQRAVGIRLADARGDASIGFWRALLRNIVWAASTAILIGFVTVLLDRSGRRRGWHDLAAGAVMIDRTRRSAPAPAAPAPVGSSSSVQDTPSGVAGRPRVLDTQPGTEEERAVTSVHPVPAPARGGIISSVPGAGSAPAPVLDTLARADDDGQTRAAPSPWASLTWDDGSRIGVYGRTLFGRNPAGEPGVHVVAVRDETLSLSKTHFEVGRDEADVWVADRHSTNGTTVVRDGRRLELAPGDRMPVRSGDRLEFGDRSATVGGTP